MARIVLRLEGKPSRSFDLSAAPLTVGRAGDNDVVIDNARVSRYHARIAMASDRYEIADLGSTNGVRVNGELISGVRVLRHGDHIRLSGLDLGVELVFDEDLETVRDLDRTSGNGVHLDLQSAEVWIEGRRVALTLFEQRALDLLHRRSPALVSKEDLARAVWIEDGGVVSDASIEQLIHRLRGKLRPPDGGPERLQLPNVRGLGYRLLME